MILHQTYTLCLISFITILSYSVSFGRLTSETIIGGSDVGVDDINYVVSYWPLPDKFCGGFIIDDQFVVTVAHCVITDGVTFRNNTLTVTAGVHNLYESPSTKVTVDVEKIYITDRYNHSHWTAKSLPVDDIAVFKLKRKLGIGTNPGLSSVNLPKGIHEPISYENKTAVLSGFGYDYMEILRKKGVPYENGNSTGKLRKAKVLIVNNKKCTNLDGVTITDSKLCGKVKEKPNGIAQGACTGDSGSPLVYKNKLIRLLTTSNFGCNDNEFPSTYTRVSHYLDFIRRAMIDDTQYLRAATYT